MEPRPGVESTLGRKSMEPARRKGSAAPPLLTRIIPIKVSLSVGKALTLSKKILPESCRGAVGTAVPIPTLPLLVTAKLILLVEEATINWGKVEPLIPCRAKLAEGVEVLMPTFWVAVLTVKV